MPHQFRVTKYTPDLRDRSGAYPLDAWTSRSDIGRVFEGKRLTSAEYQRIEKAHLFAIEQFLKEAGVRFMTLKGLENSGGATIRGLRLREGMRLNVSQILKFAKAALRERLWGRLVGPRGSYIHFGYDYYLYIGVPKACPAAILQIEKRGLFVEPFRSPYLRSRSNNAHGR